MRRIRVYRFGGPEVLQLEEAPAPSPGPGEVLVRIKAAGVNPVDTYLCSGSDPALGLPYTPGFDAAGTVDAVGEGVRGFAVGERVYTSGTLSGTYADFALAHPNDLHPLPEKVSFPQGAAIGVPYATAFRALFQRAHALPGEVVLVHGASGGVGIAAVQIARAAGMEVIGTGGTPRGRSLIAEQGARFVLDHRAADYLEELLRLTDGRGVDVILEMLANANLGKDLTVLAPKGRVVVIGSRGPVEINPRDAMRRDAAILAMVLFNASESERSSIHAALVAGLENGTLRPVIGRQFPLAEAPRAHQAVLEPGACGKVVLIP